MPDDIHFSLWSAVQTLIEAGAFCCNTEIWEELEHIEGVVGECLAACKDDIRYEIGEIRWDWKSYLEHVNRMRTSYRQFISEYNGNRKNTVGLNDVSIVAMAKTMHLPVVSMEGLDQGQPSTTKMRIPRLCIIENVDHLTFNELLRREGVRI